MNTLTGIFFKDKAWYVGICLEIPSAATQGKTLSSCKKHFYEVIK